MTTSAKPNLPEPLDTPSPGLLKKLEDATLEAAGKLLGIPKKPKAERLHKLTPAQEQELREIEDRVIAEYQGDLSLLEAALGMLRMGHHFGWKVLYLIHSKKTIRKYEEILGVKIRELFAEVGPSSYRSVGFQLALRFSNFWKVAGGDIKIPKRKDLAS
jgi:hypothetical protein